MSEHEKRVANRKSEIREFALDKVRHYGGESVDDWFANADKYIEYVHSGKSFPSLFEEAVKE